MSTKVMRQGKTERDHKTGAWNNRFANRAKRVEWEQDAKGTTKFPTEACNGKRNRHRVTGKQGKTIILK